MSSFCGWTVIARERTSALRSLTACNRALNLTHASSGEFQGGGLGEGGHRGLTRCREWEFAPHVHLQYTHMRTNHNLSHCASLTAPISPPLRPRTFNMPCRISAYLTKTKPCP
jgi:hypothetical protein